MSEYKAGMLRAADWFDEAADDLADWGMYVSGYFQEKHGLSADIKKYRDRAAILRAEAEQQPEHTATDRCGFDRNASHSEGRYVCLCESTAPERVMVPVKPTEKMIKAAIVSWIGEPFTGNLTNEELDNYEKNRARDAWSAMLRAAQEAITQPTTKKENGK